jgi:hypothetical protein
VIFVQPKLVLNNVDVLRKAICEDETMVPAAMYHDSFIWRVIALMNSACQLLCRLQMGEFLYSFSPALCMLCWSFLVFLELIGDRT